MKEKVIYLVLLLLFVGGMSCSFSSQGVVKALWLASDPIPYQGTRINEFYSQFYFNWEDSFEKEDKWSFSPELQGDCDDFAVTFCGLYPEAKKCWVVIVPAPHGGVGTHAVLFLESADGWYAVDNQPPYLVSGENFLDLYRKYEVQAIVSMPDPGEIPEVADLTWYKGGE